MYNIAKKQMSKVLAGLLAVIMMLSLIPVGLYVTAFAAGVDQYSVMVVDEKNQAITDGITITLTNKADSSKKQTEVSENGVAIFKNFVEEDATYIVSVDPAVGYEDVADYELSVAEGDTETTLQLTALEKVTLSGTVVDETGAPYVGAKVVLTGYLSAEVVTTDGTYSFEVFKGKDYSLTATAKEDKYNTASTTIAAIANDRTCSLKFTVKEFNINTAADENGTITSSETVSYGDSKKITATANDGYCIDNFIVNGTSQSNAKGLKSFDYDISSVTENYNIEVKFARRTYKIIFDVRENGDVIYDDGAQKVPGGSVKVETFDESTDPTSPTKVNVKAVPAANYRVSKVIADNASETFDENDKEYSKEFVMTTDHSFVVEFKLNTFNVTIDNEKNGTATVDKSKVDYDGTAIITIKPNDGFNIESVTVNGIATTDYETNDGAIYQLTVSNIKKDTVVKVSYSAIETIEMDGNVSFNGSDAITVDDSDANIIKYVFANDKKVIFLTENHQGITINGDGSFDTSSFTVADSESVSEIIVYNELKWYNVKLNKKIQIVIDKVKPVITTDESILDWTNSDKVTISGRVTDENSSNKPSSGLNYVVWKKDSTLTPEQILAESVNKANISADGRFTFESEMGEQDSIYYIYAVDISGNISAYATTQVRIDKKAPVITAFTFSTEENNVIQDAIKFLTFGIFCNEKMYVTVEAKDDDISSGLNEIELYTTDGEFSVKKEVTGKSATFELTEAVFKNGKELSAKINDVAGNNSTATPTDTNLSSNYVKITTDKPTVEFTTSSAKYTQDGKLWYDGNTVVTVKVSDEESKVGIYSVSIKLNGVELEKDINNKDINDLFYKNPTNAETFEINTSQNPVNGENVIEVSVTNNAGITETKTQNVYIDTTAPQVSAFEIKKVHGDVVSKVINFLTFGIFCNDQVEITVTSEDAPPKEDGVVNTAVETSGIQIITLYAGNDPIATAGKDSKYKISNGKTTFVIPTDEIVGENKVFDKVISATATDNVGNVTEHKVQPTEVNSNIKSSNLMIETVKPIVSVTAPESATNKNTATADNNDWYKSDIDFTITAKDEDSGIGSVMVKINDQDILTDKNGKAINEDFAKREAKTTEEKFVVNTNQAVVKDDGSYTLTVEVIDNAGNVYDTFTKTVYKDVESPVITGFKFNAEDYKEGSETDTTVEVTDYGFYFTKDTSVTVSAKDDGPSAGIKSITYYTVDIDSGKSEEITEPVNSNGEITFTVKASFKGQIYAKATDNVLNTATDFVNPNSAIVEDAKKHKEENHIKFAKEQAKYKTSNGSDLYAENVSVEITVTDTYSGIRSIEWSVEAPYDTDKDQSGRVTVANDRSMTGDGNWTQTQTEANLVYVMKKTIIVNNNSNDIVVNVKMTDRAGNTSEEKIIFNIDKTAPTIEVTYDNNTPDETYTDFFKADRKATVKITERNFNKDDVVYKITNTDGTSPSLSDWTEHKDTANPDATYYTAEILYHADGDYTFDISYADLAKNKAADFAQHKFTIDQTMPTVSVAYDNMSALNGNYYKADRVATITIVEHNFDAARVTVIGTATDNGATVAFPVTSAWNDNGDTHTATIHYASDAKYSFDIEFNDKAGNSIADYTPEEFYVDKTAPTLEISGVADKSANNGTVAPVITFTDTNYNGNAISYTLTGVSNGKVNYSSSISDIANGQRVTFADFEKIQKVDDIYILTATLTDMAGNETTKSITFSANRFGSVYDLATLEKIIGKYLQNEEDVVFTETNVDSLKKGETKIKLTKNGTPKDLVEGTDYTVTETGGNGQWSQYKYTINKALFTDDGRYSISVYSVDAAGNINENIDETKKAEISFGVDKTKPVIVPIDFESDTQYPVEVKTVSVEIKDNLVLEGVKIYLNGSEIKYNNEGETYTFDIPEKNEKQNVRIVAVDAAGNEYELLVENFLVSTNLFVRWFNNTPLFIGSIAGVVILCGAIVLLVMFKRKKSSK